MNKLREKVFRDPVYGYVHVTEQLIWDLIKTKEVQRLRRIKQLGGTHMVFHTAEHSRFSHSLGVYEMARKMIAALNARSVTLSEHERMLTLAAALLHDLGHGPFSHAFESVTVTHHEAVTGRILLENTEVHAVLESYRKGFSQDVHDVIAKTYANPLIVSIISSQLDADRLDYLLRDAYFTGAPYGEIDVERILRTMRVVDEQIVYKVSGMHAIEDYLMSRYQMYWQVYLHGTGRSFDFVIQKMLRRVVDLVNQGYTFKQNISHLIALLTEKEPDINVFLKFDDTTLFYYASCFTEEDDVILADLADRFVNRRLYKTVTITNVENVEAKKREIAACMQELGIDPTYYLILDHNEKSPYDYYESPKKVSDAIGLLMLDDSVKEISEVSNVIRGIISITPKEEYKVYFAKDLITPLKDSAAKRKLLNILHEKEQ